LKQVFAFIRQEAQNFAAKTLCRVLMVSKSAYYGSLKKDAGPHESSAASSVREVFSRHCRRYGSRRIHAEMKAEGKLMGRHKIRRIMREQGLRAIQPKRFVPRTTDSRHGKRMSPNLLLERDQPPSKPDEVVVGDITYLPLASGRWAYLATWEDLYSRMTVGWQVEETLEEKLVIGAMQKVILRRRPKKGLIVHSDRGGQYVGEAFRRLLELHGYQQSMSRAAESYDNAYAESLFSRYKAELLEEGVFADAEEARMETFNYIEGYYNRIRRHSALGHISPEEYERKYYREVEEILTANQRKE
jgi:transposase InsO family protein